MSDDEERVDYAVSSFVTGELCSRSGADVLLDSWSILTG